MAPSIVAAATDLSEGQREALFAVLWGSRGWTVRCTPRRWTLLVEEPAGCRMFCKIRWCGGRAAAREWRLLQRLPEDGVEVCEAVALLRHGRLTAVVTRPAPGRPVQALLADALELGDLTAVRSFLEQVAAPFVARLHRAGWVFRDLYWNHLFAASLESGAAELTAIDVERAFKPRWRRHRWLVKDLAGLAASAPANLSQRFLLRGLRVVVGGRPDPGLVRAIIRKAARIRGRRPRYGA